MVNHSRSQSRGGGVRNGSGWGHGRGRKIPNGKDELDNDLGKYSGSGNSTAAKYVETKEMPRRPLSRCQLVNRQPLTFSPFARSVARVASAYIVKRQLHGSKFHRKSSPNTAGYEFVKHNFKEKSEQPESYDGQTESSDRQTESSDEEESEEVVQADFAFFDPKTNDFHGVKILLQTYLDDKQWDLSGFVDLILGQTTVGTVVKIEGNEDDGLFCVITALNLGRYTDHKCIMELKAFLLTKCKEKDVMDNLRLLLGEQAQNVGLLVSQRVTNLPPQLLPPLYNALFDEVLWATEDEPTEELRNSFRFKYYLIVSKFYKLKNTDQKKGQGDDNDEGIIYIKPEDEIFHKLCSWSFIFPLRTQQLATHELRNYQLTGLVMAVEAGRVHSFEQDLQALINES